MIRNTQRLQNLKEKWLNLWKSRDRLWHRMNRFVWYPSLLCTFLLVLSVILNSRLEPGEGLPMLYLYIGAAVPVTLLLLRQGLDFSYKEELVMASLADYEDRMSAAMHRLLLTYARRFNKRMGRTGHLFQNRFDRRSLDTDWQVMEAIRSVHADPQEVGVSLLAAALAHQLQKLPPVFIALKDELLVRTAGTDIVKAGNRSPNALHGAPFAGICLHPIQHD